MIFLLMIGTWASIFLVDDIRNSNRQADPMSTTAQRVTSPNPARPSLTTFAADAIPHLMDDKFYVVRFTSGIPQDCKKALPPNAADMAELDQEFQVTDAVFEKLPWCRLIVAGEQPQRCFVHYECGGRGHSYNLVIAGAPNPQGAIPVWRGYSWEPAPTVEQLRREYIAGKFEQEPTLPTP